MTPLDQWPETVELLVTHWKCFDRTSATTLWSYSKKHDHISQQLLPDSLDSLAAISEAIGVVTETNYRKEYQEYESYYCSDDKWYATYQPLFPDEITARLAAVNAAVRYAAKEKENEK